MGLFFHFTINRKASVFSSIQPYFSICRPYSKLTLKTRVTEVTHTILLSHSPSPWHLQCHSRDFLNCYWSTFLSIASKFPISYQFSETKSFHCLLKEHCCTFNPINWSDNVPFTFLQIVLAMFTEYKSVLEMSKQLHTLRGKK